MSKVQSRAHAASKHQQAAIIQGFLAEMERMIGEIIPETFQWWVTVDPSEGVLVVEYVFRENPEAILRQCSGRDFSSVWASLAGIDWGRESTLAISWGAGGESPPDRPATNAQAGETGRGTRQDVPTALRSRRRSRRGVGQ